MAEQYIDILMNDHALIEKAIVLLERETEKGDDLSVEITKTLLDFLWDYGDLCHNTKEEKVYFPLLLEKGLPPQGPIGVMLQEHEQEREYIKILKEQIEQKEISGKLHDDFSDNVKQYSELTKNHIWKENDILYPMGRRILTDDDDKLLLDKFTEIETQSIGKDGYKRYLLLINSMEKQSGGQINLLSSLPYNIITDMLDILPVEISYVDADDRVRYFNKLDKKKIFPRTLSVIGRTVQQCHPQKSVHLVNKILEEMKAGTRERSTFWIDFKEMFVYISYFAVRDSNGKYQGCIEMVQDIKPYRDIKGEKRLLDNE